MSAADESEEQRRHKRIRAESERATKPERSKHAYDIAFAIWAAVEDLDKVPEGLHAADVVTHHLQRGNIRKDGQW